VPRLANERKYVEEILAMDPISGPVSG